jgi:hypothetical protein
VRYDKHRPLCSGAGDNIALIEHSIPWWLRQLMVERCSIIELAEPRCSSGQLLLVQLRLYMLY